MPDELLDVVDQYDQVICQKKRSEIYADKSLKFRGVNAFVINQNGELWIPRRSADKRIFPLCLDASMGGHVEVGESYEEAFFRELIEELRIDARLVPYEFIGKLTPYQHKTSAFIHVYLIRSSDVPQFNTNDFTEYFWLKPHDLLNKIASGDRCKSDLPLMVRHFFIAGQKD